ncbi:MAG: ribokinase [Gammaproteobacteria bacterium]|nr:ribokinase [Gammaproteobacteria bacterium]RPG26924.1 MAG: ribokinase [Gammaproteobacteria bacterium TMED50]|tara:strand:- start:5738 stop:6619 length:882 start_codon:yes stop_codon:yes gene_type:complete
MTVYVIGGINQDIVATSDSHPRPGETLTGHDLNYYPGGKGANQAVGAARAGADVAMIACRGNDVFGEGLRAYLVDADVDCSRVRVTDEVPTGTALIVVAGGENSIIVVLGANGQLRPEDIEDVSFAKGDVVVAQFETPTETTLFAFKAARQVGAKTLLNPSPVVDPIPGLIAQTDVLVVNEHEFEAILGEPLEPVLAGGSVSSDYAGTVVVTLGSDGVLALPPVGDRIRHDGVSVDVLDSTGAGDCYMGYLAASLHAGDSLETATGRANQAAAISVTRPGAASSIPEAGELAG